VSPPVTRRSALTAALVALAGGVGGYVWARAGDAGDSPAPAAPGYGAAAGRRLVALDRLPDGGGVITGGVVVTRTGSSVHAFSSRCTHLGCTVNSVRHGRIYCPCHGSVFDARTGAVLQPPATVALPPVRVTVRDGGVYTA
jgi:Rieske Fe-S protein